MSEGAEVIVWQDGPLGRLRLNRPEALNALTHAMALEMENALIGWRNDPSVTAVVVDAEGDRAFCAGGDIQHLYETGQSDPEPGRQFWRDEYRLNAMIKNYHKPYVAIMNGITMGGGVGVSAHGSHRIVSDNTMVAMPETSIGFLPDVGGTWLLSRAPGETGLYLGLTGARMNAADAIIAGFADAYVPPDKLPDFVAALANGQTADEAIAGFSENAPDATLAELQDKISDVFARESLADCISRLDELAADGDEWAAKTRSMIARNAPLALASIFEAIQRARNLASLEDCLSLEFNFAYRAIAGHDFLEGIRAMVIDKDRKPQWRPATLDDVTDDMIDAMLAPLGEDDWRAAS